MTGAAHPAPVWAIEVTGISVALGGAIVLDAVSLHIATGEWVSVIGPNGAGKSTLLRAVGGLVRYSGLISLYGSPVGRLRRRERARLLAMVAQAPVVPTGMSVVDYVMLGRTPYLRPLGRPSATDTSTVEQVLLRLDLHGVAHRLLETLSGGERQRAFLARALAQQAPLLLLDEPTSALDIGHQQEVLDLVDELRTDRQLTVLATMHDLSAAGEYADRLVLLADGRVAASGTAREVLTQETLRQHYGARVRVLEGERGPFVVPVRGQPS